jgi:signal transduction histidine kinase
MDTSTEIEIKQIYDTWFHAYVNGDIKTYAHYLHDAYRFIGSTSNEEYLNKEDTISFFEKTAHQFSGKIDSRNIEWTISQFGALYFITHFVEAYFLNNGDWDYYGRFRFTSVVTKTADGYRFIYQHFSMPDAKADEGETIGFDAVANENIQLKEAIKRRTAQLEQKNEELHQALEELKATQAQLIQSEKLASLGQLAAGIAHEIKNPMNFINNFSELSLEYVEELKEALEKLDHNDVTAEMDDLLNDVADNLKKVHHHGTRADNIVKSMLMHSRGGTGTMEPTDLNALIKEYVNLAFHGMRAGKAAINVTIDLDLDDHIGDVSLNVEDFSRVILNLCKNAFDAMRSKSLSTNNENYHPILRIRTYKDKDQVVHIEIEDNGPGVAEANKDKLFQPFFTTKKGTEGTGLGLSITHDIITKHKGSIDVTSEEDYFTRFHIYLPQKQR